MLCEQSVLFPVPSAKIPNSDLLMNVCDFIASHPKPTLGLVDVLVIH